MDSLPLSEQDTLKDRPEASSAIALLQSRLSCIQQGRYSEGIAFFALAREQLSPNMMHLAIVLEACIQDYVDYRQSQQALQQASECFVKAHAKQQAHATFLAKLLSELLRNTDSKLAAIAQKNPENHHISPSLSEDSKDDQVVPTLIGNALQSNPVNGIQQAEAGITLPALHFTCFGRFEVKRSGQTISLCSNRNGQAILRYMVAQSNHRVTMDTLMALLWPEDEPEVAHHKLQVAISALRRSLNNGYVSDTGRGYILCLKALLGAYQPILEEELNRARKSEELKKEAESKPPSCEDELVLANRIFDKFFTEEVALRTLPPEGRQQLGPIESWRWCLLHIRCCIIFGWIVLPAVLLPLPAGLFSTACVPDN